MTIVSKGDDANMKNIPREMPTVSLTNLQQNCGFRVRYLQVLLLFLGGTIGHSLNVGISVAVVPMTDASTGHPDFEDYKWNKLQKDLLLSSYFWGHLVTQIPFGYFADIWSSQKIFAFGAIICGVFNMLIPVAARFTDLEGVIVCRIGMGLTMAGLLPCTQSLLSKWAPPAERSRLGTFAYSGGQFGTVITLIVAGVLAESSLGWPSIFYMLGALAIVWGIAFLWFGADSPSVHRSISQEERMYIEESLKTSEAERNEKKKIKTPWKEIFTSKPMWAIIIAHSAQNWGYVTLLTEIPSYMSGVMKYKSMTSGSVSSLPYLAMLIFSLPVSWLCDFALKKGVSRDTTRKIANTVAFWGPALALACISLVPIDDYIWAVTLLVVTVGLNAACYSGFQINHIDLSPNFAGTMMAITSSIATIAAIIAPLICGVIVTDESNADQWNIVFYVSAIVYFVGNLVFLVFGKAEVQWWNDLESPQQKKTGEE